MDKTKQVNQFSLNDVNLESLLKVQTHSFMSDDALVILWRYSTKSFLSAA